MQMPCLCHTWIRFQSIFISLLLLDILYGTVPSLPRLVKAKVKKQKYHIYHPHWSCEGYVSTPVCQSFCSQGGSAWVGAPPRTGTLYAGTPPWAGTPPGRYTHLGRYPPGQVHPPQAGTPPGRYTPWAGTPQADTPLGRYPHAGTPPSRRLLLWTVRILLEWSEGYVFTPVCQSFCSQGGEDLGRCPPGAGTPPSRRLLLRTVRILLECILVYNFCQHMLVF